MGAALVVEAARRKNLAASTTKLSAVVCDDSKNKRKTPSPVMGIEPAAVSAEPLWFENNCNNEENDESMDTDDTFGNDESGYHSSPIAVQPTSYQHDMGEDATLPSPARRDSFTPISRRLAFQFDSISFYSPMRPSTKRRKTFDTSAVCP